MSKKIQITLPDKTYKALLDLAEEAKIKPVTLASALLQQRLENWPGLKKHNSIGQSITKHNMT